MEAERGTTCAKARLGSSLSTLVKICQIKKTGHLLSYHFINNLNGNEYEIKRNKNNEIN